MANSYPYSGANIPRSTFVMSAFLLLALLVYPFTIAGSNLFLALLLIASLVYRDIFSHGWSVCWAEYKPVTIGILLLIGFNFIGSLWGPFNDLALHKMGKQINWLLIPVIIGLAHFNPKLRKHAFVFLSIGMFLHLIICTLQYNGILSIVGQGSNKHDATGYVGHLSFGFIYGIWTGLLLIAAQKMTKTWRYSCYALALYAVVTVFLAQGRSGYITTFACIALVIFKALYPQRWKVKLIVLSLIIASITIFISAHQPTRLKLEKTAAGVSSFLQGNWHDVDTRIQIWAVSLEIWKENPWFGVGTAGYPDAAMEILKKPKMDYLELIGSPEEGVFYGHPHHEFLFALSRWGPLGLLALLYLCWHWLRTGWAKEWRQETINAYLITASGMSVILHGLTEPSLNTHIETVFAIMALGFGLSDQQKGGEA